MKSEPRSRSLYAWEVAEANKVFRGRLDYSRVVIHENDPRPDMLDRAARRLRRMPPLTHGSHNAFTIGNHCFFPVTLPEVLPPPGPQRAASLGWLIHELGHAWQFQHMGWSYILRAIWVQIRQRSAAYDLPDLPELKALRAGGRTILQFSMEQQCELIRFCYLAQDSGEDSEAYQVYHSYVQDIYYV